MKYKYLAIVVIVAQFSLSSCGSEKKADKPVSNTPNKKETPKKIEKIDLMAPTLDNKGIGPIKNIELDDEIDQALVKKGKALYKANCTACHKFKKRYIGPALKGVTERRSPEWIMNLILNSMEMLEKDPVAIALITKYIAPMAQQDISEDEARAIVEYLRTKN